MGMPKSKLLTVQDSQQIHTGEHIVCLRSGEGFLRHEYLWSIRAYSREPAKFQHPNSG